MYILLHIFNYTIHLYQKQTLLTFVRCMTCCAVFCLFRENNNEFILRNRRKSARFDNCTGSCLGRDMCVSNCVCRGLRACTTTGHQQPRIDLAFVCVCALCRITDIDLRQRRSRTRRGVRLRLGRRLQGRVLFPAKAVLVAGRTALQIDAEQRLQSLAGEFLDVQQNNRKAKLTRQLSVLNLMLYILTPLPPVFPLSVKSVHHSAVFKRRNPTVCSKKKKKRLTISRWK